MIMLLLQTRVSLYNLCYQQRDVAHRRMYQLFVLLCSLAGLLPVVLYPYLM